MKRILWTIVVMVVLLVGVCGTSAAVPAMAAQLDPSGAKLVEQSIPIESINALPVWVWLILLPLLVVFVLLCVVPLFCTGSPEMQDSRIVCSY
jgi:hypothetical protein